ncbi:hypothetical protein FG386_001900 [Cryptosporidium ryanae]|uniref:uncharacterized protein n=1 Tax=Cryptosporidium ryanae TaxID=515981 RepID=UPI00351A1260|nr:hypothetical protein FG386_001900 [Cryptosporidium ryanae]
MNYCHNNKDKFGIDDYKNTDNVNNVGYAGVWPSNYNDVKVLPIGTPGVTLTDIYDNIISKKGNQSDNKPTPIGDHSYPVPVPVPVITPRTRRITKEVLQEDALNRGQSMKSNLVEIKPKRRSMESINIKNKPQGSTHKRVTASTNSRIPNFTKKLSNSGSSISNDQQMKGQNNSGLNRQYIGRRVAENGNVLSSAGRSVNSAALFSSGARLRRPIETKNRDEYANHSNIIENKRSSSVNLSRRNNPDNDKSFHQVPEDYCSNLRFSNNISCYPTNSNDEFPTIPYPFSMNEDNDGYLESNYESVQANEFGNSRDNYNYGSREHIAKQHYNHSQYNEGNNHYYLREHQQKSPIRGVTQSEKPINSSGIRNFYYGRSHAPMNTNLNRPKNYSRYVDNYYNTEELYQNNNNYYGNNRNIKRSSSGFNNYRPTLTNQGVGFMNPLNSCIPNYESPNQLNPPTYNCYSVPKRYNRSIQDFYREDSYSDLGSCMTPTKTLMYCSGQYPNLEANRHIRENYSPAEEVFKPKMYETIIYPPGYFEYKKQLDELKRKYMLERDPNAFYSMKSKGDFLSPESIGNDSFCICNDGSNRYRERARTNPIFVKTTKTFNHYNRAKPNPACYC